MERERERKRGGAVGFGGIEVAIMYVFKLRRFLFSVCFILKIFDRISLLLSAV